MFVCKWGRPFTANYTVYFSFCYCFVQKPTIALTKYWYWCTDNINQLSNYWLPLHFRCLTCSSCSLVKSLCFDALAIQVRFLVRKMQLEITIGNMPCHHSNCARKSIFTFLMTTMFFHLKPYTLKYGTVFQPIKQHDKS